MFIVFVVLCVQLFITVRGSDGLYCFRRSFFLCAHDNSYNSLHLAQWTFAWTGSLTTARNPENLKVMRQRLRSQYRVFEYFAIAR